MCMLVTFVTGNKATEMIQVCVGILVCLSAFSMAEKAVITYEFPKNTCSIEPYNIDRYTNVLLTFNGDFGSKDCRMFTLKVPDNPFYLYQICRRKWYYESPKCQSKLRAKFHDIIESEFSGQDCPSWYDRFDGCVSAEVSDLSFFILVENHVETSTRFNNYWFYPSTTENPNRPQPPDKVNDTFKIEIYVSFTYNYTLIGGVCGGVVGLFVIIVVVILIVRCLRRRKRATGMYCCSTYQRLNADNLKLSGGLSNECSCFGFTIWSCIICKRQEKSGRYQQLIADMADEADSPTDSRNKVENVSGLQHQESLPPVTESSNEAN